MVRVSKAMMLGACISSILTGLVLIGAGTTAFALDDRDLFTVGGWMIVAAFALPMLTYILVTSVFIHRMWAAIQFGGARLTPAKAVGLCFVPLFNLYWVFPAVRGWAVEYNRIIAQRQLNAPRMSEGLALAVPLCIVLSMLPYCGLPVALSVFILVPIFIAKAANCVNALADAMEQGAAPVAPQSVTPAATEPAPIPSPATQAAAPTPAPIVAAPPIATGAAVVPVAVVAAVAVTPARRLSRMAIFSLILGILGFVTASLGGLVGIVLGFIAWRRIANPERQLRGKGIAIAGILTGFASLALTIVAVVGAMAWYYSIPQTHNTPWVTTPFEPAAPPVPAQAPTTITGTIKAAKTTLVKPTQTGDVKKIVVTEGQIVRVGDPLIELDDAESRTALDEAEAALKEAATARQEARKHLTRARRLLKEGTGSNENVQSATEEVKSADETYNEARATRDTAKETLGGMVIASPMAGQVMQVIISEGDSVGPEDEVVRISDLTRLDAVIDAPKSLARRLQIGQRHSVQITDTGRSCSATIRTIESDPDTDTCTVTLQIADPQDIKVGAEATVTISHVEVPTDQ